MNITPKEARLIMKLIENICAAANNLRELEEHTEGFLKTMQRLEAHAEEKPLQDTGPSICPKCLGGHPDGNICPFCKHDRTPKIA